MRKIQLGIFAKMDYCQKERHKILILAFVGSNPTSPVCLSFFWQTSFQVPPSGKLIKELSKVREVLKTKNVFQCISIARKNILLTAEMPFWKLSSVGESGGLISRVCPGFESQSFYFSIQQGNLYLLTNLAKNFSREIRPLTVSSSSR